MYCIKVDGQEIYSPAYSTSETYQVISPRLRLEINTAGELSFTMLPGHEAYDSIKPLKSIVTMEQDGVEIFRGRALQERVDLYKQKEVYCEGVLSYLLDSVQRPFTFSGTLTAFLKKLLADHNAQVEAEKHFTLGNVSALTDNPTLDLESDGYTDTLSAIRAVLEERKGYLFTRYQNGTLYLDYLEQAGNNAGQSIAFGVNLVDLEKQTASEDICTVMLPIGGLLEDGTTVTIASVNGGSDTIENAAAIAKHGRIVKAYTFDNVIDPAELKRIAQEKLSGMVMGESLTLKAVDMHMLDSGNGVILPGTPVQITILPHGIDKTDICISIDLDPENPEDAEYTFGKPVETQSGAAAMIANRIHTNTKMIKQQLKHYTETDYTVKLHAGLLNDHDSYISQAFIELDGIEAKIDLKAEKTVVDELGRRVSSAEIAIDGANAEIAMKVSKNGVVSAINMSPESIKISASKIQLDGQTIVGYLSGTSLDVSELDASEIWAGSNIHLSGNTVSAGSLYASSDISTDGSLSCGSATIAGCSIETLQTKTMTVLNSVGVAMSYATAATPSGGSVEVVKDVSVSRKTSSVTFYTT